MSLAVIWLFSYWDSVYTKHRLEAHPASVYLVPFIRASMFLCAELHTGLQTGVTFQHLYPKMSVVTSSGQRCFYATSALTTSPRFVAWAPGLSCMFSLPDFWGNDPWWSWSHFPMGPALPGLLFCGTLLSSVPVGLVVFYFSLCVILCFIVSRSSMLQAHRTGLGSLGSGDALRSSRLAGKHSATRIYLKVFPFLF